MPSASNVEALIGAFRLQAGWCAAYGSPFTAALLEKLILDLEGQGPAFALVGDWPGQPIYDAVPARLCGALHAAVLLGRDPALAAQYPQSRPGWDIDALWPIARAYLERDAAWLRVFLRNPPQTNETRRTIALLPGFLDAAKLGPMHLLELGASAGLNAMWDRFRYRTHSWTWGEGDGPEIDTDWQAPIPAHLDAHPVIASRAACDQQPMDVHNPEHVLRLRAYVWADQHERRERLDRAIALAQREGVRVETADAGDWLTAKLAGELPAGVTLVYHSVAWQYFSAETKAKAIAAIEAAAARARPGHYMGWLRYEAVAVLGLEGAIDDMAVALTLWPGGTQRVLARADGHARSVRTF